jgi:RluA family pseudouridine synthase
MTVISYIHTFKIHAKGRWLGKKLFQALKDEFHTKSACYFVYAIKCGAITVNGRTVSFDYVVKNGDVISHKIHIHEPSPIHIRIIAEEEDFLVVNKPAGIGCHPTSHYNYFTVTKILEEKFGKLSCINRLDVPTSGVLLLAKSNKKALHDKMKERKIEKMYLAKVKGNFEDTIVTSRIKGVPGKNSIVDDAGKECITRFELVRYSYGYSLIKCFPITGRSHQIRVHLKSIGSPIINDKMYNDELREEIQTKEGSGLECECFVENSDGRQPIEASKCVYRRFYENMEEDHIFLDDYDCCSTVYANLIDQTIHTPIEDPTLRFIAFTCEREGNRVFKNKDDYICLHAYQYTIDGNVFKAELPEWAKEQ